MLSDQGLNVSGSILSIINILEYAGVCFRQPMTGFGKQKQILFRCLIR